MTSLVSLTSGTSYYSHNMAILSDLPDETLHRVLEFVTSDRPSLENTSLVNSRFNKIAFPLLVRQWHDSQECLEPSIERLALHLLRNPDLRRHVERLDLGYLRPLHDHDPDTVDLSPESLAALADAAEEDLEVSKFLSTHVCHRIRLGCEDAIAVLILAWCTRLTHLTITIPSFYPESRQHFMPLLYVKEAICRLLDEPAEMASNLPLGLVSHVTLQPWNSEEVFDMAYARSFLHLPCIQTFCVYGLIDDLESEFSNGDNELPLISRDDYELPFPVSTSPITELRIVGCLRSGVPKFISACRTLKKLNVRVDHGLDMYGFPDQRELAKAILKQKDSLEDLDLDISIPRFPNPDPVLEEIYSQLSRIRTLAVHIVDFFEDAHESFIKIVLDRIPKDIQVLKPRSHKFIETNLDLHGLFTGRDYGNYPDGFNPYRADLYTNKQVPRTWKHIKICIVSGSSSNDSYAALSYVWGGGTPGTQLKTFNEEELQKPGSLSAPGIILGNTITDAMKFCHQIGLRFLWVDQLCIPQKPGTVDPEIHHMASIYSGSACTLVALSGASFADPLPGAVVGGLRLMTCYPSLFTEIESSVWFSRGWTFHEAAFSRRIFFFTTQQTFFLCRKTMYCEESVWEVPGGSALAASANTETREAGRIKDLMLLRSNGSYPEGGYYRIAEEYTKRTLGHPEDILNAWAGAVQWMEEDKKWGSTCSFGLPLDQFGFALGWQPVHGHNPDPDKKRTDFPRWSWSSFQGPVEWRLDVPLFHGRLVEDEKAPGVGLASSKRQTSTKRCSPFAPHDPILEFKTSAAHITVGKEPDGRTGLPTFNMIGNDGYSIGSLQCDPGWRAKQPDKLEFIVFATAKLTDPEPPQYSGYPAGCGTSRYNAKMSSRLFSDQYSYDAAVSDWQDAADTFDDTDSTFSGTDSESLESLRSSVLRFQEENGRTYHAMSSGKYNFPNDASESDRLDLQHNLWLLTLRGELGLSPKIKEPAKRVMDVGTGTGIWAIEYADLHPEAQVVGVDLSPIQPSLVPPNCTFEIDDLEKEWMWTEPFDFIFCRVMTGSFADMEKFVQNAYDNLEPGGYLEMQDLTYPIACDDGTLPPDCEVLRSGLLSIEASAKAGRAINLAPKYKSFLEKAGFVDVVEKQFKWPINEWPKDKHYKELGKWSYANINNGLEGLLLGLFTRFLG
ncbi:hypothetical protein FNAPI_1262 [Fusarium napiforme]|uniref:Heterokaryon incompatibility domain-containing protein n=1 Tax=Fusarium napiforme TaxID=42672 RepID=A0A8H5K3M3_9HYPO|nr:hypothetical protein FNAPI_1262 [Fusarium napiforme]